MQVKKVLVLARNNMLEAMRVAAGLTIVDHEVTLVFMSRVLTASEANSEQAELLELVDIEPLTTVPAMQAHFRLLTEEDLGQQINAAQVVINL